MNTTRQTLHAPRAHSLVSIMRPVALLATSLLLSLAGCKRAPATQLSSSMTHTAQAAADADLTHAACRAAIDRTLASEAAAGTPELDRRRVEILGRALAEPVIFLRPPEHGSDNANLKLKETPSPDVNSTRAIIAINKLIQRHRGKPEALRAKLLRQGYLYSERPYEAFAMVKLVTLDNLFDEQQIWLQRGEHTAKLVREKHHRGRYQRHRYVYADGAERGHPARLLLFDRVAASEQELAEPLHRDVVALRDRLGFDRLRVEHLAEDELVAHMRHGQKWVRGLFATEGAQLSLVCLDADNAGRDAVAQHRDETRLHRRAVTQLQTTMAAIEAERLPFDRPRGERDHFSDGQLRPQWNWAYKTGRSSFNFEEQTYRIFDDSGRPHPPQMCVETILDGIERASGTWYAARGQKRARVAGAIDFNALGIENRASVLGFETYASKQPELFTTRRIKAQERIAFARRKDFFRYLTEHADAFAPADVVAIRGRKRDDYIHQHAILIEDTDPMTGFAYSLFDQMRLPRRRTWEAIMAEAPKRSLLYQIRMHESLLTKMAPATAEAAADDKLAAAH